jgi:hypothetical protein
VRISRSYGLREKGEARLNAKKRRRVGSSHREGRGGENQKSSEVTVTPGTRLDNRLREGGEASRELKMRKDEARREEDCDEWRPMAFNRRRRERDGAVEGRRRWAWIVSGSSVRRRTCVCATEAESRGGEKEVIDMWAVLGGGRGSAGDRKRGTGAQVWRQQQLTAGPAWSERRPLTSGSRPAGD